MTTAAALLFAFLAPALVTSAACALAYRRGVRVGDDRARAYWTKGVEDARADGHLKGYRKGHRDGHRQGCHEGRMAAAAAFDRGREDGIRRAADAVAGLLATAPAADPAEAG